MAASADEDPIENETRWLVSDPSVTEGHSPTMINQAYLFSAGGWCVRVRRAYIVGSDREGSSERNTVAVKGPRVDGKRVEYEWEVSVKTAIELYRLAMHKIVKQRFQLIDGGYLWDVDRFYLDNEGLVIAECEQEEGQTPPKRPTWCSREITADTRYNNEELAQRPWRQWS